MSVEINVGQHVAPCYLLKLPPEIRLIIWCQLDTQVQYVLLNAAEHLFVRSSDQYVSRTNKDNSLLHLRLTCKTFCAEATPTFFERQQFFLTVHDSDASILPMAYRHRVGADTDTTLNHPLLKSVRKLDLLISIRASQRVELVLENTRQLLHGLAYCRNVQELRLQLGHDNTEKGIASLEGVMRLLLNLKCWGRVSMKDVGSRWGLMNYNTIAKTQAYKDLLLATGA